MFAALQQRQQQQRQKLQMLQQSVPRTGSSPDISHQRSSQSQQSTGQAPQPQVSPAANAPQFQQRQAIQNLDPEVQRRVSSELNTKQFELFMKSLMENCKRRNTPLHAMPEIQGHRVNLFVLYMMVQKLGGGESVTRFQQWPMLAQKLQLPDDSPQQLASLYYHVLLPYEQYLASPEGIKETQSKRLFLQQFLQELLKKILGSQANLQGTDSSASSYGTPANTDSKEVNKVKKPRKPKVKKKSKKDLEREMKFQQEQLQRQHQLQQEQQNKLIAEQRYKQQQEQLRLQQQQALQHSLEYQKLPKVYKRSFARNYVPFSRPIETSAGYDMRAISQIGEKIDANKPAFLFAPELGTINLHALSLSLLSGCLSEVNVALNTLLVTSADAVLKIPLDRFDGLTDSLAILGCRLLNRLCLQDDLLSSPNIGHIADIDVERFLDESTIYSAGTGRVEKVYQENTDENHSETIKIRVDSLTGVDLDQSMPTPEQTPAEMPDTLQEQPEEEKEKKARGGDEREEEEKSLNDWDYLPDPLPALDDLGSCTLEIPTYLSSLRNVRDEVDTLSTKVNTRGAENSHILIVDQLSTISMILRNLSFSEANTSSIANNTSFKRFLSDLMWTLFLHSEKFVTHRKAFNFRKDIIIALANLAHLFKIDNHVSACLLLFLIVSFSEGKNDQECEDRLTFPEYSVKLSKYQSFGVDVLAKILSLGYPNRVLIKAVLLRQFDVDSQSQDVEVCQQLLNLYDKKRNQSLGGFNLLNDVFTSLISIIPFQQLNLSPTLVEDASPMISQSVTALLSLVRLIEKDNRSKGMVNLPLFWLSSEENIGSSLRRLSEALSNIGIHTNSNLNNLKLLFNAVSAKSLQLVCLLIEKSLELADQSDQGQRSESYICAVREINSIPNLLPSEPNAFSLLTNPMADYDVAREMSTLYRLRNQLISAAFQEDANINAAPCTS